MRNHTFSPLGSGVKIAMCILFFLSFSSKNFAQSLTCSMNQVFQMPTNSCALTLTAADILSGSSNGVGPFSLSLEDASGNQIANNMVMAQHMGQTIMATVSSPSNNCMVTLTVQDNVAPTINCTDVTVECNVSTTVADIGLVTADDFCSGTATTIALDSDVEVVQSCPSTYSSIITRQFSASDTSGNSATCVQNISIRRPFAADVVAPADVTINCGMTADPNITGEPLLNGNPLAAACALASGISNSDTVITCASEYIITREWLIMENGCTNNMAMLSQTITVIDTVSPVLICAPSFTYSTVSDSCFASIPALPMATLATLTANGCGAGPIHFSWAFGTDSVGPYNHVPPGIYPITYTIETCGGRDTCVTVITVQDNQVPTPVCRGARTLSLTTASPVMRFASWFDAGSADNCANVILTVRRDAAAFSDRVFFDCADVNQTIMVTLRVTEANNPASFADCMTSLTIQDKLGPNLTCPANVTVDCLYDYLNPDLMGSPTAIDACAIDTITLDQVENVNACGVGTVTRTYTASDVNGNESTCIQTITVENMQPFVGDSITWPLNYMTFSPAHDLQPDSLPTGNDWPVWTDPGCSMIGVTYQDELINVAFPACYKIVRRWTVVDWCQRNPSDTSQAMRWQYNQTIQVLDNGKPVLTVPADVTVSPGAGCTAPFVSINAATAVDISPDLRISNNSAYADDHGANASGYYPIGVHTITYRATDGCGNITVGTSTITVRDVKAPSPICRNGLTGNMTLMSTGYMLEINAAAFNGGSTDNCTAAANLDVKIRVKGDTIPPTPTLIFDCDSKGFQQVEMHVTDALGNSSYCETYIIIQDNMNMCPPDSTNMLRVAGCVLTDKGDKVEGVAISLANLSNVYPVMTDYAGNFLLENLPMNGDYTIDPNSNEAPLNGVNTYDILKIQKHLLGLEPLTTPYSMIAADVNNSKTITPTDILDLRKLILGMYDEFPSNDSWRFVDADFNFPVANNPWISAFPEVKEYARLHNNMTNANFKGIKIGDVNGDVVANALKSEDRNDLEKMILGLPAQPLVAGQEYVLPISGRNEYNLEGLQMTLGFDLDKVEFIDWSIGALDKMEANVSYHREGRLAFLWTDADGKKLDNEPLFYVKIKAKSNSNSQDVFFVDEAPTPSLVIEANAEPKTIEIEFLDKNTTAIRAENQLLPNQPNPFRSTTSLRIQLVEAAKTRLEVFDATGRLVYAATQSLDAGLNHWILQAKDIQTTGVYAYRISAGDWSASGRLIKE